MVKAETEVVVAGVSRREMYNFMLNCTDEDYQAWWPGTHLAFHTVRHFPGSIGSLVYFDEVVSRRRMRFHAVVIVAVEDTRIYWQMKQLIRLPAWVTFALEDHPHGVLVRHTLAAGFSGIGRLLDPFLHLFLSRDFIQALDDHARTEFPLLADLLIRRRGAKSERAGVQ